MIADLNRLEILEDDIGNAYLNYIWREKICFTSISEFGNRKGASVLVVHEIYGLKYSGADCRAHYV